MTLWVLYFPCFLSLARCLPVLGSWHLKQWPEPVVQEELYSAGHRLSYSPVSSSHLWPPGRLRRECKKRINAWSKLLLHILLTSRNLGLGNFPRQRTGLLSFIDMCYSFISCIWLVVDPRKVGTSYVKELQSLNVLCKKIPSLLVFEPVIHWFNFVYPTSFIAINRENSSFIHL